MPVEHNDDEERRVRVEHTLDRLRKKREELADEIEKSRAAREPGDKRPGPPPKSDPPAR